MASHTNGGPTAEIPGGPVRASRIADRRDLPALEARERVSAVLRVHDEPDAFDRLEPADLPMVRLLAGESAALGGQPAIRYSAIAALAHRPGAAELNLLTDLARFGEDSYVRGHALLALGRTGSYAHLPVLSAALEAEDDFERGAAGKAIAALARHASPDALAAHAAAFGGPELGRQVRAALGASARRRAATPRGTSAEPKER